MDKLAGCALAFEKLLDVQYRMIVGRKGKAIELLIGFSMLDFHHLMGLGKLKNLRLATMSRETVFKAFLPKEQKDYTKGQAVYTLLYKEKSV